MRPLLADLAAVSAAGGRAADAHPAVGVAARQGCRGALTCTYDIPEVTTARPRRGLHLAAVVIAGVAGAARHTDVAVIYSSYGWLLAAWTAALGLSVGQWVAAILERLVTGWSARLDALRIVVCVPVYNEDPATLDRVLYALAAQTRPSDAVHVVDHGSAVSYDGLQRHWQSLLGHRLTWTR